MKAILIFTTSAFFVFGTTSARESVLRPVTTIPAASANIEVRVAQLVGFEHVNGAPCITKYITTTRGDGTTTTRKSVDCEE